MDETSQRAFENAAKEALEHHRAHRLDDAESAYKTALSLSPGHTAIMHNLGVVAAEKGEHRAAIECFDRILTKEPRHSAAHYNRATSLNALGLTQQAIQSLQTVCILEPEHYSAHRSLAFLWLSEGNRDRALDYFARTYELRRGADQIGIAQKSQTWATRDKLQHDAEQFRYLLFRRRGGQAIFERLAQAYDEVGRKFSDEAAPLTLEQLDILGDDYNKPISITEAPEIAEGAVNVRADREDIVRQFRERDFGVVHFDDLLTPAALQALKKVLLESTIWHDFNHIGGFVASYLEDGLACPLVLQIADELRTRFPELLERHALSQAWAFKGLKRNSAVEMHADDAAVSVNFWITPDSSNLVPEAGGLSVCRAAPPEGWSLEGYDADKTRIGAFVHEHATQVLQVPYRENRSVLFESRLFHWSDAPVFKEGYENHRINLTFLFGQKGGKNSSFQN